MGRANRTAIERGRRVEPDLPRVEDLDDAETGLVRRRALDESLDESLYELTVLPVVHLNRVHAKRPVRAKGPVPPLPRIGSEDEDLDTDIVAPSTLHRLRAEAKIGGRERMAPEALVGLWDEVVGPDPDAETASGVRTRG